MSKIITTTVTERKQYINTADLECILAKYFAHKWSLKKESFEITWDDCWGEGGGIRGVTVSIKSPELVKESEVEDEEE